MSPQATNGLRELMNLWFNDPVDETGPWNLLVSRGWTDTAGMLRPPTPSYNPSQIELACIDFLCQEWDYAYEGIPDTLGYDYEGDFDDDC